jgi:hypothetical protein
MYWNPAEVGPPSGAVRLDVAGNTKMTFPRVNQVVCHYSFNPYGHQLIDLGTNSDPVNSSPSYWRNIYFQNFNQSSDQNLKTDIQETSLGLPFILKLNPVQYKFKKSDPQITGQKDENNNDIYEFSPGIRYHHGLIAQDVKRVMDENNISVNDFAGWGKNNKDDPNSEQFLRYGEFISPLIKAIKELNSKIETLEAEMERLKNAN